MKYDSIIKNGTVVSNHAFCGEEHKKDGVWELLSSFGSSSILYPNKKLVNTNNYLLKSYV